MTLSKQVMCVIIGALFVAFFGAFSISVHQSKSYFEEQLQHNAQDTATSLGLSLSKQFDKQIDKTTLLSKIDAIFDSGYFNKISVVDNQGVVLVSRYASNEPYFAPRWFMRFEPIHNVAQKASIVQGWKQLGYVFVQSDESLAYLSLWQTTKNLFLLMLSLMLIIVLISLVLTKVMFRTLNQIIEQVQDIGKMNFYTIKRQTKLNELEHLSSTINTMSMKLKQFIEIRVAETEKMRAKTYEDNITGLGNRRYFFAQLKSYLADEAIYSPGFLALITIGNLAQFTEKFGYHEGDTILASFAEKLNKLSQHNKLFLIARLDGPDFGLIFLERDAHVVKSLVANLSQEWSDFLKFRWSELSCFVGVTFCGYSESSSNIMTRVDKAVSEAKRRTDTKHFFIAENISVDHFSNQEWKRIIQDAIKNERFNYYQQPVISNEGIYHEEIFIKLLNEDQEIDARTFFTMVDEYSMGYEIEKYGSFEAYRLTNTTP